MSSRDNPPDLEAQEAVLRDWMTLWHSEVAAMGVDREMQETWMRMAEAWYNTAAQGGVAEMFGRMMPSNGASPLDPAASTGANASTRSASAAHASDAGGELASLRREIGELRNRIEQLETAPGRKRRPAGGT
jgi:hypothetical protein